MSLRILLTFSLIPMLLISASAHASSRIEADPSKTYSLTRQRGPWMIMVATFHTTDGDGETDEGKSPQEAATELVLELRQLGLPAYIYEYEPGQERVKVTDRLGREEGRKPLRRYRSTCVLAGNYGDIDEKLAQDSLQWVKKLRPKCLREGVVYYPTPGRPGPLSGAFLTLNPLLDPSDVEQNRRDPLLVRLNSGERFSLLENRGTYTLVVARFYGKHMSVKAGDQIPSVGQFLKENNLDNAALSARELVTVLRGSFDPNRYDANCKSFCNLDAYIWHDRHESIVTVGSFSSPNDPSIARYVELFGSKVQLVNGVQAYQAEYLSVGGFGKKGDEVRLWLFEPDPDLLRVPNVK